MQVPVAVLWVAALCCVSPALAWTRRSMLAQLQQRPDGAEAVGPAPGAAVADPDDPDPELLAKALLLCTMRLISRSPSAELGARHLASIIDRCKGRASPPPRYLTGGGDVRGQAALRRHHRPDFPTLF